MKFRLVEDLRGQFQVQACMDSVESDVQAKDEWVGLDVLQNKEEALKLAHVYKEKKFEGLFRYHEL